MINDNSHKQDKMLENLKIDRYKAGMVLGGVGDALGYRKGDWEFCNKGEQIRQELNDFGGLQKIHVKLPDWPVSDDTVMHLATANALIQNGQSTNMDDMLHSLASEYKTSMEKMKNRSPGETCERMCEKLEPSKTNGLVTDFNPTGGGCGAAMRSMCIGLRYPKPEDLNHLIAVSIESGRLTHHHPTGYLGSLASALFASFAVQGKPLAEWGFGLLKTLPEARSYVENKAVCVGENMANWNYFELKWRSFLKIRNIVDGKSEPLFPPDHHLIQELDQFYSSLSYNGCGGASGHDAPMIAYDAILGCNCRWEDLCNRAMFHGGDSDSTGTIAGCLFGILYGFNDVPKCNHKTIEFRNHMKVVARRLFDLASEKKTLHPNNRRLKPCCICLIL